MKTKSVLGKKYIFYATLFSFSYCYLYYLLKCYWYEIQLQLLEYPFWLSQIFFLEFLQCWCGCFTAPLCVFSITKFSVSFCYATLVILIHACLCSAINVPYHWVLTNRTKDELHQSIHIKHLPVAVLENFLSSNTKVYEDRSWCHIYRELYVQIYGQKNWVISYFLSLLEITVFHTAFFRKLLFYSSVTIPLITFTFFSIGEESSSHVLSYLQMERDDQHLSVPQHVL